VQILDTEKTKEKLRGLHKYNLAIWTPLALNGTKKKGLIGCSWKKTTSEILLVFRQNDTMVGIIVTVEQWRMLIRSYRSIFKGD